MSDQQALSITTKFPQFPDYSILISLFENVKNARFIRSQLLNGNQEYEYAFVNPSTVCYINNTRTLGNRNQSIDLSFYINTSEIIMSHRYTV